MHVIGRANKVADWRSRDASFSLIFSCLCNLESTTSEAIDTLDKILRSVHGGRKLHFGAAETWRRAKLAYPQAHISIEAVRQWVRDCLLCQKLRDTGIVGLPEVTRTLKPISYRRAVGVDHFTVTPEDANGNKCGIMIVEHYSHFPQAYPAKDYSAETLAKALFKHFCTFGMFDELVSDPGSALVSDAIAQLNKWLGLQHKVSLVGRHESNGCEGSIKQFLRHLSTLVMDERLVKQWSDDSVFPLINFALASYPTSETGGYTPFQLKYGTEDAQYFKLPAALNFETSPSAFISSLDTNLKAVREASNHLMQQLVAERKKHDLVYQPQYEPGDLVLWNQKEHSHDFLPSKLSSKWLGPYEVVKQFKNDVTCRHVCLHSEAILHVSRLKPFFGSLQDAIELAKLDHNQYEIISFNWYRGNPHVRTSMEFSVTFEDGTITMPYSTDLADSQQFHEYVHLVPALFPLRYTAIEAKKVVAKLSKLTITTVSIGDLAFLNLRYFDGETSAWFDSLNLPHPSKLWVANIRFIAWPNKQYCKIKAHVDIFNASFIFTSYDIDSFCTKDLDENNMVLLTSKLCQQFNIHL